MITKTRGLKKLNIQPVFIHSKNKKQTFLYYSKLCKPKFKILID
jgi:hypothetical protein